MTGKHEERNPRYIVVIKIKDKRRNFNNEKNICKITNNNPIKLTPFLFTASSSHF